MGFYRTSLAIAVFLFHAPGSQSSLNSINGRAAVFCFFVISGFYIEMILSEKYTNERLGSGYKKAFYMARFWRLYPIYISVTLAALIGALFTHSLKIPGVLLFPADRPIDLIHGAVAWFANFSMLLLNVPSVEDLIISPGWSIGVEVAFYGIAPFLLKARIRTILVFVLLALILQFIPFGQHAPLLFGLPFFILGVFARRYRKEIISRLSLLMRLPLWLLYACLAGMVLFSIPHDICIGANDDHVLNALDIFFYSTITAIVIPLLHERTKSNRLDYLIGQISYPFYIVHQPIVDVLGGYSAEWSIVSVLLITFACAMTVTWIELTLIEPRRQRYSHEISPETVGVADRLPVGRVS
jgi:peptidoglycan/LPS O-acetylase OafA/YrhL